jgi:hypothetical protein
LPNVTIEKLTNAILQSDLGRLQTADGVSLMDLWDRTLSPGIDAYNTLLNQVAAFMAYKTDSEFEEVVQAVGSSWQKGGTEVVKGVGQVKIRGFWVRTANDEYKKYMGWTRKYIKENSSARIVDHLNAELKALQGQKYNEILSAWYNKGERSVLDRRTHETLKIPCLVDGTGNMPIPSIGAVTFDGGHSHFMAVDKTETAWTNIQNREAQLKSLVRLVKEHGFFNNLVILCSSLTSDEVATCPSFRGFVGLSPFGASDTAALAMQGAQANVTVFKPFAGIFRVIGTLPFATVLESDILPAGYISAFSYQGQNSPDNPIQYMESPVVSYSDSPFAFYETILETEFGASIRKRLNGAHLFVGDSGTTQYANPTLVNPAAAVGDWDGN